MFQLLSPIWLSAIAALSIPVVIHLWNIRPGKTLQVGSISLIEASSRKSSRSFNLMDVLLLILRCLFLGILALLLSQPYWSRVIQPGKVKGWLLIPRQNIHQVYSGFKPKIDSLSKAGYQLHYFNDGFALIDTAQLKTLGDSAKAGPIKNWVLLKRLITQIPPNLPVYLFTSNRLNSISGARPLLGLNIKIQTFTPADSTSKWINNAALISTGDAVKITEGSSKPSGTTFINTVVQSTERRNSSYQINITNGKPSVSFKGDSINTPVDTTTLQIAVYSNKNNTGKYLTAALSSIKQFSQRKINVVSYSDSTKIPNRLNWLFWLSEELLLSSTTAKSDRLFVYDFGKAQNVNSWIGSPDISLSKIVAPGKNNQTIWSDGFGAPILSLDEDGKTYHFSTRLDPSWTDLVWNDAFPQMLFNLLFSAKADAVQDRRIVSDEQLTPQLSIEKSTPAENKITTQADLSKVFWLALALLLISERWLAHRNKTQSNA